MRDDGPENDGTERRTDGPQRRLLPQNLEAEQSVLGSILIDNAVFDDVAAFLVTEDFWRDSHKQIYAVMLDLYGLGIGIDCVSLAEELSRRDLFGRVGGDEKLAALIESVPHSANAVYHAQIVKQKAIARNLIEAANQILRDAYAAESPAEELVERAEQAVFRIADGAVLDHTVTAKQATAAAIERVSTRGTGLLGLASGIAGLDTWTDGFHPETLTILAARPSMGKTALALCIAEHAAIRQKRTVYFVSLEMGEVELGERLICMRSTVPNDRFRHFTSLHADEVACVTAAMRTWETAPLRLDVSPERTSLQILAGARRLKTKHDLGLIVVDYLQLVKTGDDRRENRSEAVARISRGLKWMARELKVPVIALSQLNRAVESREDRRPRMADLRESGAIEQDADTVLLLHRPDYYDPEDLPGQAELIVAKNRNGATGTIYLDFHKHLGRFSDHVDAPPPASAF